MAIAHILRYGPGEPWAATGTGGDLVTSRRRKRPQSAGGRQLECAPREDVGRVEQDVVQPNLIFAT
jgi:hypothetical protein